MGLLMLLKKITAAITLCSFITSSFAATIPNRKTGDAATTSPANKQKISLSQLDAKSDTGTTDTQLDAPDEDDTEISKSTGRFLQLPRYKEREVADFVDDIISELELKRGYKKGIVDYRNLRLPHQNLVVIGVARKASRGKTSEIYFGYLPRERRLPLLWIYGVDTANNAIAPNPDASPEKLDAVINSVFAETKKIKHNIGLNELAPKLINLSYTDADAALFLLRSMGYSVITETDGMPVDDAFKADTDALKAPGTFVISDKNGNKPTPSGKSSKEKDDEADGKDEEEDTDEEDKEDEDSDSSPFGRDKPKSKKTAVKNLPTSIAYDKLPLIVKVPSPDQRSMGLVGAPPESRDSGYGFGAMGGGSQTTGGAIPSSANPLASPIAGGSGTQIMVLHHPTNVFQYSEVKKIIDEVIDTPVRQVYVEGLILEISKKAMSELGVQWSNQTGKSRLSLGTITQLSAGTNTPAGQLLYDSAGTATRQFMAKINALIDEDKAEVLSRPSVLTLDNRQAVIRVGTDIPIATSIDAPSSGGTSRVAFTFNYQPTGILLNIRPKISDDQKEVSMIIDATVSDRVPGADLRITDSNGSTLASAPTISTRKIQTYARIYNNNPLIIGGLVNKSSIKTESKVPGLGSIPILGNLFGYKSDSDDKTEVIIVLTPTILTEEYRATKAQYPKDDNRFDQFGTQLFRESYRIRAEDLIDSQYIRTNQRLLRLRNLANIAIKNNPALATEYPFNQLQGTRVPGEFIFVSGMMSRMLERLKVYQNVNIDKLMFFEKTTFGTYNSTSVGDTLKKLGDGKTHEGFFKANPGKALTLTFKYVRGSTEPGAWAQEPTADVQLVDCTDRNEWKKLLWEKNQPVNRQHNSYTIVIQSPEDLDRLKLAIATKNTVLANGNERNIIFDNFLPGRMMAMQEISPTWERMLEASVARYFYYSQHFYGAFTSALENTLQDIEKTLKDPNYERFLSNKKFD